MLLLTEGASFSEAGLSSSWLTKNYIATNADNDCGGV